MMFNFNIRLIKEDQRIKRLTLTAITSAFARSLSVLVPLIVVRIALKQLGSETYGLWMTVTSFFSFFTFADLGLGSGLQTKLSKYYGSKNKIEAQKLISCASVVLVIVSSLLLFAFILLIPNINWIKIMNAESKQTASIVSSIVIVIIISKIAFIPLGLVQRVQFAFQEGYISNLWNSASSVLSLITVYIVSKLEVAPIWIIFGSSFAPILIAIINHAVYFFVEHKELKPEIKMFQKEESYDILKIGIAFMILSIFTTFGLSMDSFIIAHTCNLESVTPYSIGYRIASVMSVAITMLSIPLWAANGEAYAKHDFQWIQKITKRISQLCTLISIIGSILLLIFGNGLIRLWLGETIKIPFILMSGLLFMQIIFSFISPYFMVLNGAGIVKKQIILFSIYTPISLCVKYFLSLKYGATIIPWIGALLYILIIVLPIYLIANKTYKTKLDID